MDIFLSNLGIDPFQQARPPTADVFPLAFNPNNKGLWVRALENTKAYPDIMEWWGHAIHKYVDLCAEHSVFPFQDIHQAANDQITSYLLERRRVFVKFVDQTDFFHSMYLKSTHRKVVATDSGFSLAVYADAQIKDPTFVKWLLESPLPRFTHDLANRRYVKQLMNGLAIFAYNQYNEAMSERWEVGYEIDCPMFPEVPTNNLPSKKEIEEFVLEVLWMPLLRSMRPLKALRRLI